MAAISTSDYHTSVRKIDTVDALWAIISSQPKKIRRALAERLQGELVNAKSKKTGLDKALDDVENGLVSVLSIQQMNFLNISTFNFRYGAYRVYTSHRFDKSLVKMKKRGYGNKIIRN